MSQVGSDTSVGGVGSSQTASAHLLGGTWRTGVLTLALYDQRDGV